MSELFSKEDIFTPVNAEEARGYIGKKGYFASNLSELKKNINSDSYILSDILDENTLARFMYVDKCTNMVFELFLPADKVKQPEPKKWRPFKGSAEFIKTVGSNLGDVITISRKDLPIRIISRVLVTEFRPQGFIVGLGTCTYSYRELFEEYEWLDREDRWQPFGVEELNTVLKINV